MKSDRYEKLGRPIVRARAFGRVILDDDFTDKGIDSFLLSRQVHLERRASTKAEALSRDAGQRRDVEGNANERHDAGRDASSLRCNEIRMIADPPRAQRLLIVSRLVDR